MNIKYLQQTNTYYPVINEFRGLTNMDTKIKRRKSKNKLILFIILLTGALIVLSYIFFPYLKYTFYDKSSLILVFKPINQNISVLCAEPSNKFYVKIEVRTKTGKPVNKANIKLNVKSGLGYFYKSSVRTDKNGEAIAAYIPPSLTNENIQKSDLNVTLSSAIDNSNISSSFSITLEPPPVILVHGYQADGTVFNNISSYLASKGIRTAAITYKSQEGVVASAAALENFLNEQTSQLSLQGIQVKKYDLITHSMGGLVARYYTCSPKYPYYENVRKLIFLAVPHKGSVWAPIGRKYYDNQAIEDLMPENELFTVVFPSLINKGLNNTIQTGNIRSEYDEVVSPESSSLEEWNIKTEVFNVGDSSFTMNNLLTGNIMESPNHKSVLNNKKIFEKLTEMLFNNLPYPSKR